MDVHTALSAPARRRIVELLAEHNQLSVTEISSHFQISQPAISQHLKILREAGIITAEKHNQRRLYEINRTTLQNLATWVAKVGARQERFAKVVAEQKQKVVGQ